MKIHRVFGLASPSALVAIVSLVFTPLAGAAGPGWYDNFEQAVQAARQQGRPIFVDFSTSWCSVCKQMDRTTLADPAVISRLDNFIKVKVDGDAFPQLCQAYGVEAYPTFVHLDPTGRFLDKRVGGMRVQEMASALDSTLQSVSTSMAIAQANRQAETRKADQAKGSPGKGSAGTGDMQVASADLQLAPPAEANNRAKTVTREIEPPAEASGGSRNGARTRGVDTSRNGSLYNVGSAGNNVYASETAPVARRSRFGEASEGAEGLKKLAEATGQPGALEESEVATEAVRSDKTGSRADAVDTSSKDALKSKEETKAAEGKALADAQKAADSAKESLKPEPLVVASSSAPAASPVIESRLAGLPETSLPKPLLSRTNSNAVQTMAPAAVSSTKSATPLAAEQLGPVGSMKRDDTGAPSPAVSTKSVEIASAKPQNTYLAKSETKPEAVKEKADADEKKSSAGATKGDITRWMKDADTKLVEAHKAGSAQLKKEARAMYNKVVEKDPENTFGKSDMAYVKMVSLIVDKDSDLLRRQAYNKIKEFETRFPKSDHKDYYTLIRAMLAADLGESTEAHKLLADYGSKFPESRYVEMAKETSKSLPAAKKESAKSKSSSASTSSKKKSSRRDG